MGVDTEEREKSQIEENYSQGFNDSNSKHVYNYSGDPEDTPNPKTQDDVKNAEEDGAGWKTAVNHGRKTSDGGSSKNKIKSMFRLTRKKSGIIGIVSLLGIGGGILGGLLGPGTMLINLAENFTITGDSSSTSMERRFMRVFKDMTNSETDPICANSTKKGMKCRNGRKLSNSAIRQLNRKAGITAMIDGKPVDIKRTGFPSKNPTQYKFPDGKVVDAKNLTSELLKSENRKLSRKVMGTGGAFNMRTKAWVGKHITSKLYKKFNIDRRGGLANGQYKGGSTREKISKVGQAMAKRIPGSDAINQASGKVKDKINKQTGKAKKGGIAYLTGVAGCIAVRAPGYIAAGVAAVQMLQLMPFATEFVLSPGNKAKAGDIDPEDMEAIGSTLTQQTKNDEGKMTSALDSKYLMTALGVNTGRTAVSETQTPGYSVLTNKAVQVAGDLDDATRGVCNVILSPAAMWTAVAVNAATTAAASATIVGGLAKFAIEWTLSSVVAKVAAEVGGAAAKEVVTNMAESDAYKDLAGEKLGDTIGLSAMAFFSAGGMSRHLPGLSEGQLVAYDTIRHENESFNREMDIAALSPLDTSSPYTFMGSITRSLQMAYISGGSSSPLNLLGSIIRAPSMITTTASAAQNQSQNTCGHAKDFGMDTGDPATTPAINAVGMPCTGITSGQATMSTDEAINLIVSNDWVDEDVEIPDEASIEDLMPSSGDNEDGYDGNGYIKSDTPLYEFITSCSNPESGDYLFASSGCITPSGAETVANLDSGCAELSDGTQACGNTIDAGEDATEREIKDADTRALQAMSVFLLDFQMTQSVNGMDEEDAADIPAGNSEATDSNEGGTVNGTAQELAQKILDNPNVTYWDQGRDSGDKSRPSDNLRSIAAGELANTSTRGPAGGKKTTVNVRLLQFMADIAEQTPLQINAITGQVHSANSDHYKGLAVDFGCGNNKLLGIANEVGKKYGVSRNNENCSQHAHWHYRVNP